ncbi:MAG: cysteine synthase family protein [Desulfurococcaceae archaeon]|jgi:cysteine synthase/O-phosphoserine sulfhydrylase/cystathionine beta-synthase|nr:cysteine synthase family protein [Desulfurococcaceae archaeon]
MQLESVDNIICKEEMVLEEFLRVVGDVLRRGGVEVTVVIDRESKRVIENSKLCVALKKVGVKFIPVSYGVSERVFVSLESMGFFDDINPSRYRVFTNTEELLYKNWPTPLVKLANLSSNGISVWAKLEGFNPWSMSVKDRIGWYMYRKALERLGRDRISLLVESTSTNTGLAIAAMASIYKAKLKAFIPSTVSKTGETLLKIFGAEVIRSPKPLTVELIDDVEEIARKEGAVHLNQFYNDANFEVHLRYTAKELELQIREAGIEPKAIFGGLGTSGHMSAISFYFKNRFKGVKIYGVVPAPNTAIQGIRRVESGMKWVHYANIDNIVEVTPEEAVKGVLEIVRNEGIFVGLSSGAVYMAFKKVVKEGKLGEGDYILIFPDIGFKYVEQVSMYIDNE